MGLQSRTGTNTSRSGGNAVDLLPQAIADDLWFRIHAYIEDIEGAEGASGPTMGRRPKPARLVFEAIAYILSHHLPWKSLPRQFGSANAVHARFVRWRRHGLFDALRRDGVLEGSWLKDVPWPDAIDNGSGADADPTMAGQGHNPRSVSRREKIKQRILAAAALVFERNGGEAGGGFERTTVEAIAREADVSTRTFFRYFRTKAEAIYTDWGTFLDWYEQALSGKLGHGNPLAVCLETFVAEFERFATSPINRERIKRAYRSEFFAEHRSGQIMEARNLVFRLIMAHEPPAPLTELHALMISSLVSSVIEGANVHLARYELVLHREDIRTMVRDLLTTLGTTSVRLLEEWPPSGGLAPVHPDRG